jgi:glycosyltransferase involved in cell wall biosynthesis
MHLRRKFGEDARVPSVLSATPRIAIAFQGDPTDPRAWSGVLAGISAGLSAAGAEPVPIDARFPGAEKLANALNMSWADAAANGTIAAVSGFKANRSIGRAGRIDGVVAIGSGFTPAADPPFVTFEDMTVALALRQTDPAYQSLSKAGAERWRARQKRIYERGRACCMASAWAARSAHDEYGIPMDKIHVVGFGRNREVEEVIEREWSEPRFLFVGFDWERKRGAAVVKAFTAVRQLHPSAKLDLVGGHPPVAVDGVTGHGFLSLDSETGRRKYGELLDRATCFLMPSTFEPFGIAYLDAGAAGVPSIGSTVGGAPDAVGPGGVVVDPGDDDALLDAMLELAVPETAQRLGGFAREHSAQFTWRAVAERLLRALQPPGVDLEGLCEFLDAPSPRVA